MTELSLAARFGSRIRIERHLLGWTQAELAQRAGISVSHLREIEHGRANVRLRTIDCLADALDKPPFELLDRG